MSTSVSMTKPELPSPFPPKVNIWTCPKTGLIVPKDPEENLKWRARLLKEAEGDEDLQRELYTACSQSLLFWVNAFAFTFRVQEADEAGRQRQAANAHIPFVTWGWIQDQHMLEIEKAIEDGYDLLTDKTRDMGASWNHIAVLHHQWLFRPGRLFLEMSRVETDVDGANNPRCLFVKHDYINKWLPEWMLPRIGRTTMHIVNLDNDSRIDGESSNKAAASGDRRHAVLLDEFSKMENADKIKTATADVTPCRLVNATPWGPGTTYSKWRMSGQIKVFVLPWYEHPEKGFGRYVAFEAETGKWKIRSKWYDFQATKRSPQEMAQEIDMDHIGSGEQFFEAYLVEEHKRMFGRKPSGSRGIQFRASVTAEAIPSIMRKGGTESIEIKPKGPLRLWVNLIGGRLDQSKTYVMGIDVSKGQGASNSIISIYCKETGEKVAEWADANTPPYEFSLIACAVYLWVGGLGDRPLMIWEANGPGWDFGRDVVKKYCVPRYFVDKVVGTEREKKTTRYGWNSSPQKKEVLLGNYRRAMAHGGFINHSIEALDEMLLYIRHPDGELGPAALMEESKSAKKTHGDRVMGDALALWGCGDMPSIRQEKVVAPHKSIGGRKAQWMKERKRTQRGQSFDFRSN